MTRGRRRGQGHVAKRRETALRNKYHEVVQVEKTPTHTLFNSTIERLDPDLFDSRQRQLRADVLAEDARKLAALQPDGEGDSVDPRSFLRLGPPDEIGAAAGKAAQLLRPHPGLCIGCQQTVKALKLARQKVKHQRAAQQLRVSQVRTDLEKQDSELQELVDTLQSLRAETKVKQEGVSKALVEAACVAPICCCERDIESCGRVEPLAVHTDGCTDTAAVVMRCDVL
jgi:hypothetical protein